MSLLYMLACQNDGPIYLALVLEVTVRFATEVKFVLKLHPGDFVGAKDTIGFATLISEFGHCAGQPCYWYWLTPHVAAITAMHSRLSQLSHYTTDHNNSDDFPICKPRIGRLYVCQAEY